MCARVLVSVVVVVLLSMRKSLKFHFTRNEYRDDFQVGHIIEHDQNTVIDMEVKQSLSATTRDIISYLVYWKLSTDEMKKTQFSYI